MKLCKIVIDKKNITKSDEERKKKTYKKKIWEEKSDRLSHNSVIFRHRYNDVVIGLCYVYLSCPTITSNLDPTTSVPLANHLHLPPEPYYFGITNRLPIFMA